RGNRTSKVSSEHFNAFDSPNYPPLVVSGVNLNVNYPLLKKVNNKRKLIVHKEMDDNVLVLKLFPGINEKILKQILSAEGLKGIVLETYGAGNSSSEDWFVNLLKQTIDRGVYIVNITQC